MADEKAAPATTAAPQKAAAPAAVKEAAKKPAIEKHPTPFKHVFMVDINDNGLLREVAVLKEDMGSGSLVYIDIALLDNIDKGRLKRLVTSVHADKYALWELMDQERLPNGMNALDYFHQMTRVKQGPGYVNTTMGGGLAGARMESANIAGGFTNANGASLA